MQTEFPFTLPFGFLTPEGEVYREGVMRLAAAGDEVVLLEDPRVRSNRAYLVILLFARVIVRLGPLQGDEITPDCIERLFAADLAHLQDFYRRINNAAGDKALESIRCPHCGESFSPENSPVQQAPSES